MTSLVLFTLAVVSLWSAPVKGRTDQYFTDSIPVDYYQRVPLKDCPLKFYPDSDPNNSDRYAIPAASGGRRARLGEFQHMVWKRFKNLNQMDQFMGLLIIQCTKK